MQTSHILPTLFLSHGSPEMANDPGPAGAAFAALGQRLQQSWANDTLLKPRAVLVISPHWSTRGLAVSTAQQQQAWHDFGGFAPELYTLQYAPAGAPVVAQEVIAILAEAGMAVQADAQRPLDHGTWVPLRYLFPQADLPVLQLSLQPFASPAQQFALGQALASLRQPRQAADGTWQGGVLIIASGSFTHNLQEAFGMMQQRVAQHPAAGDTTQPAHVAAFRQWFMERLPQVGAAFATQGTTAFEELFDYRQRAPFAVRNHPTDEHFIPLYIALGAAAQTGQVLQVERITDEVTYGGVLALDSFVFA